MKKPKLFYLHNDNRSLVNRLSDEQAGKVLKAIYNFADGGEIEETGDIAVDTVVDVFTNVIARQYEAYNEKCEKMRANALKRYNQKDGSATACKSREDKDKDKDEDEDENKEKDKDKEKDEDKKENENKEKEKREIENKKEKEDNSSLSDFSYLSNSPCNQVDYSSVYNSYNSICSDMVTATDSLSRRCAVDNAMELLDGVTFDELFERVQQSDFLTGRNGKWYGCNFDWIMQPEHLQKIMSGAYDNPLPKKPSPPPYTPPRRQTSYDLREVMKLDTLDFVDEEGWEKKKFGVQS